MNTTSLILDVLEAMFTFHFSLTQIQLQLRSIVYSTAPPNALRHHLSARLLTLTLLVNFFWLVFTATLNLHSIANGTVFHKVERINETADLSNFWVVFGEVSI